MHPDPLALIPKDCSWNISFDKGEMREYTVELYPLNSHYAKGEGETLTEALDNALADAAIPADIWFAINEP